MIKIIHHYNNFDLTPGTKTPTPVIIRFTICKYFDPLITLEEDSFDINRLSYLFNICASPIVDNLRFV